MLSAAVVLLCQYLTVRYNYGGEWSALFFNGAKYPAAAELAWEGHSRFPDSYGYDGQIYHLVAHDPSPGSRLSDYVDAPRLRYRRILVPALAHVVVFGRPHWIDPAYRFILLVFVSIAGYYVARYADAHGASPAWGLGILLMPAVVVSADRLVADVALVALTAAFVFHLRTGPVWALLVVMSLAALVRETGVLLPVAFGIAAVVRKDRRAFLLGVASLIPCAIWYAYVQMQTDPYAYPLGWPLSGIAAALVTPVPAPVVRPGQVGEWWRLTVLQTPNFDRLALLGALLGFGLALRRARQSLDPCGTAVLLFAVMGLLVQRPDNWLQVYDFGRVYSPMLLLLALDGLAERSAWPFLPVLLMWPRIWVEIAMQVVGVVRSLVGS